jgi:hypothetical protein
MLVQDTYLHAGISCMGTTMRMTHSRLKRQQGVDMLAFVTVVDGPGGILTSRRMHAFASFPTSVLPSGVGQAQAPTVRSAPTWRRHRPCELAASTS